MRGQPSTNCARSSEASFDGSHHPTNQVTFSIPDNENLAPRGLYMLWLVTNTGAVSDAKWVVLR